MQGIPIRKNCKKTSVGMNHTLLFLIRLQVCSGSIADNVCYYISTKLCCSRLKPPMSEPLRIFNSLPQTVFMWVNNKDATSNIKHWVSNVLSSISPWKTDWVKLRCLLLKLILCVYFQVCSIGWSLRKISVLKHPCELLWVITHFQSYNIATSFSVIRVVLLVKSFLQMRCCPCKTSIQLKWTQARIHVPRKKLCLLRFSPLFVLYCCYIWSQSFLLP